MAEIMEPISVRLTADERALVKDAARHAHTNVSDFIRRRVVEAAEMELTERRVVTIPSEHWERFEAWAEEPPRENAALRRLADARPTWSK